MKKDKMKLKLEKVSIAKLPNLNHIYGGATLFPECGTDGPLGNHKPKCIETSRKYVDSDTN